MSDSIHLFDLLVCHGLYQSRMIFIVGIVFEPSHKYLGKEKVEARSTFYEFFAHAD